MSENNVDKPFWITEAEFESHGGSLSEIDWASRVVKSFVKAFSFGAEKIFYVGLENSPGDEQTWLINKENKQVMYFAFQTMIEQIDLFESVETVAADQYKFTVDDSIVYVMWGSGELPSEVIGTVEVTDIRGNTVSMDATEVVLTDDPLFIRI